MTIRYREQKPACNATSDHHDVHLGGAAGTENIFDCFDGTTPGREEETGQQHKERSSTTQHVQLRDQTEQSLVHSVGGEGGDNTLRRTVCVW